MNGPNCDNAENVPASAVESYRRALLALREGAVPHLVGGAFALAAYAGITRRTKDLDLFIDPADRDRALTVLMDAGFSTRVVFPYWLAKAVAGNDVIDLIYRSPDGVAAVDGGWFERSTDCQVLGLPTKLCAAEDVLLAKIFILNNDRNDLADVLHLLYSLAEALHWDYLLEAIGARWRVLLAHLVLFGFVYPSERGRVPQARLEELLRRLQQESASSPPTDRVCLGTLFSHSQYHVDVQTRGFKDGRLQPHGTMTRQDIEDATISTDDPQRQHRGGD